jgi:hypothetical protein
MRLRLAVPLLPILVFALLAGPAAARRKPPPRADLGTITLDRTDPTVPAEVAGTPMYLAVTLNDGLYLDGQVAGRLALDWKKGDLEYVGRVEVQHREAAGPVVISTIGAPMLIQTQDEPCCGGHEGAISATQLPWSVVRIGQARTAERLFPAESDLTSGLSIPWLIGRQTIRIVLAPGTPETVATASAAAILADAYGGHLHNEVRRVPVAYGIKRSVRDMSFDRPIDPLGLTLDRVAVRIGDYAGDTSLPEPPETPVGKDEIVVKHKRLPPQFRWAAITIGDDVLRRCSQISVYRDQGRIGLACDPAVTYDLGAIN